MSKKVDLYKQVYFFYCVIVFLLLLHFSLNYQYITWYFVEFAFSCFYIGYNIIRNLYKQGLFSIGVVFNVYGFLYTNFLVIQSIIDNKPIDDYAYTAMELSLLGILSFNIAYSKTKTPKSINSETRILNVKKFTHFLALFLLISIASEYYVIFVKIGLDAYLFASRAQQSLLRSDYSIFSFYHHTFPVISSISLYLYFKFKYKPLLFLFFIAFGLSLIQAIISVSRAEMLALLLPLLFILNYFNVVNTKISVFVSLGGVVLFGIWKSLFSDTVEIQYEGEFNSWYRICRDVLKDPNTEFLFGKSYLNTLLNLVVPVTGIESLATWYVRTYQFDVYSSGGGRGFSAVLEAFLNFHILGVILIYSLYGYWGKKLSLSSEIRIMIFMIVLVSINMLFRSESYSFWKNMMWFKVYPILLFYYLSSYKKVKYING